MDSFAGTQEPGLHNMVSLNGAQVLKLLGHLDEDSRLLLEKNNSLRWHLQESLLRCGKTQRYSMWMVYHKFDELRDESERIKNERTKLQLELNALALRTSDLKDREAAVETAERQAQFNGIADIPAQLDKIVADWRSAKTACADRTASAEDTSLKNLFEVDVPGLQQTIRGITARLQEMELAQTTVQTERSALAHQRTKLEKDQVEMEKTKTELTKRHVELERDRAQQDQIIYDAVQRAFNAYFRKTDFGSEAHREKMEASVQAMADDKAYNRSRLCLLKACKTDPQSMIELAKEAVFYRQQEKFIKTHTAMLQNPAGVGFSGKKRDKSGVQGRNLGIWLVVHEQ